MLGRKDYTREELDHAKAQIQAQITTYDAMVAAATPAKPSKDQLAARVAFEAVFFNNLLLALDRPFVHRVRGVTGKDGNALNEVEVICESLMTNAGVLQPITVLKVTPETSVLGLVFGESVHLTEDQFVCLSGAFFADLEAKFT